MNIASFEKKSKAIVVTGGAGFLGSNLIKKLNGNGIKNIIIVDEYKENKFKNLASLSFTDYISYKINRETLYSLLSKIEASAILHVGANADVLIKDPELMLHSNYEDSKFYLQLSQKKRIPLIYASSSAIYGAKGFNYESKNIDNPHNIYAWSKWLFDKHVKANQHSFENLVVGLRLFNIFGLGEFHKGQNASIPYRFYTFLRDKGYIDIFNVEIKRDYVWVEDVADIILDILFNRPVSSGIYDLGGKNPISHLEVARIVSNEFLRNGLAKEENELIRKIEMPIELKDSFQFHTEALNMPTFIAKKTQGNREKITSYIKNLLELYYNAS